MLHFKHADESFHEFEWKCGTTSLILKSKDNGCCIITKNHNLLQMGDLLNK
jgi:hypothetical protein